MRDPRAAELDPRCLLAPARARALPEGSREREFAALCLRLVWHTLFDTAPGLLAASPPNGGRVLEPFLATADLAGLAMDWRLHGQVLGWLTVHPEVGVPLGQELVVELLGAAASRWALGDQSPDVGILLSSRLLPLQGIVAWKPPSLEEGRKVLLVDLAGVAATAENVGWWPLSERNGLDALPAELGWRPIV